MIEAPALPILYTFRRCPYAMRARLALAVSGQAHEAREVVLRDKPAALLAASPKGTVPVLVLPDGQVIDQSLDVMLWALQQNDPEQWLAPEDGSLQDMLALIAGNDGAFKHSLDRYKYPNRYPDEAADGAKAFALDHRARCAAALAPLEAMLDGRWLFGSRASLADMALLPFVRQFAHTDAPWFATRPWPRLQAWLANFEASELYLGIMDKHAPWRATPPSALLNQELPAPVLIGL
ncbi:MAG: glutathione S-transferase [Polaromonas sp.]|nr:glutathione S-transferase [Polaromonas sp.]